MLGHPFGLGLVLGVLFFAGLWASGRLRTRTVDRVDRTGAPTPTHRGSTPGDLRAPGELAVLKQRLLLLPVPDVDARRLRDDFADPRAGQSHEALDILAPRGSAVVAVDDGVVQKLFTSVRGGLTVYQFDPEGRYCYYYAHLDRYAPGLREGMTLKKGDRIGDVGTTGNAPPDTPHLHFAIFKLGPEKQWWKGAALNPFPLWGPAPARAD